MISIIICSKDKSQLQRAELNIRETIGLPFELIAIDNSRKQYGISEAYNIGAAKAKFEYLCFMHEDIEFNEKGWGQKVIFHLTEDQLALIGVAGSKYKSPLITGWGSVYELNRAFLYHKKKDDSIELLNRNPDNKFIEDVVVLDGAWMATSKKIWDEFKFDQELLKGFHGYDIDFSLRVSKMYPVAVVYDIVITHYSEGSYSKEWLEESFLLHDKLKHILPAKTTSVRNNDFSEIDNKIFSTIGHYRVALNRNISFGAFLKWYRHSLKVADLKLKTMLKVIVKGILFHLHLIKGE